MKKIFVALCMGVLSLSSFAQNQVKSFNDQKMELISKINEFAANTERNNADGMQTTYNQLQTMMANFVALNKQKLSADKSNATLDKKIKEEVRLMKDIAEKAKDKKTNLMPILMDLKFFVVTLD
ncbi:MAG: hypothetical protein ACK44S_06285 [Bacteroidota bacterium]|jgi:hypothetical protein